MRTTPTSVSVAVLIEEAGKLLLVRQIQEKGGKWGPPAGHLELGELVTEAALRETREETGFDVKLLDLVGIYSLRELKRQRIAFVFRGSRVGSELSPTAREVAETRWFTKKEVQNLIAEDNLYKPEYNQQCLSDWLSGQSFPLNVLKEEGP